MKAQKDKPTWKRRGFLLPLVVGVIIVALVVVTATIVATVTASRPAPPDGDSAPAQVLRDNSIRLDVAADGKATLVEFLDFECEVCGAFYPLVEQIRERYEGKITFAVRYFPIPAHKNSGNAALAAEAAHRQGQFEAMYTRLFETQGEWGESQDSQALLFRGFAEDLGLDMTQFDADVNDPATRERIQLDFDEGIALGVEGTPTFFLNGEKLSPSSTQEFFDAIDQALTK